MSEEESSRRETMMDALREDCFAEDEEIFERNHEGLTEDEWNAMHENDDGRPDDFD